MTYNCGIGGIYVRIFIAKQKKKTFSCIICDFLLWSLTFNLDRVTHNQNHFYNNEHDFSLEKKAYCSSSLYSFLIKPEGFAVPISQGYMEGSALLQKLH